MLVRTEYGKTIGGFTHYPWNSETKYLTDSSRRAFIFSLDMREKFVAQGDDKLIYRNRNNGPVFGGDDIDICDGCNKNNKSYANFPWTYNRAGENKLTRGEDTYRMFTGGSTYNFRVR